MVVDWVEVIIFNLDNHQIVLVLEVVLLVVLGEMVIGWKI